MTNTDRPLSTLVAQGWEIVDYASSYNHSSGASVDSVLLRRQKQHKILKIRKKWFGSGVVVNEIDL